MARDDSGRLVGILTRSDVLSAHARRLAEDEQAEAHLAVRRGSRWLPRFRRASHGDGSEKRPEP